MIILAIDTALGACAAALLEDGRVRAAQSVAMLRGHAEALMPMIAAVMDEAGAEFSDLDRVAVTVGPGSFTGLRVGVAAARGIALAAEKPAVGVTTLDALAPLPGSENHAQASVIDARHGHVYAQIRDADGTLRLAPCVIAIEALRPLLGGVCVTGTGLAALRDGWPASLPAPLAWNERAAPDIAAVAALGAAVPADAAPKPFYLKPPDAKPAARSSLAGLTAP